MTSVFQLFHSIKRFELAGGKFLDIQEQLIHQEIIKTLQEICTVHVYTARASSNACIMVLHYERVYTQIEGEVSTQYVQKMRM